MAGTKRNSSATEWISASSDAVGVALMAYIFTPLDTQGPFDANDGLSGVRPERARRYGDTLGVVAEVQSARPQVRDQRRRARVAHLVELLLRQKDYELSAERAARHVEHETAPDPVRPSAELARLQSA
jgi:hypothetical protein